MKFSGHQEGVSPIGALFLACVFAAFAFCLLKVLPPFIDYGTVKDVFERTANDPASKSKTITTIKSQIQKKLSVNGANNFDMKTAYFSKNGEEIRMGFAYDVKEKIFANIFFVIEFEYSNDGSAVPKSKKKS